MNKFVFALIFVITIGYVATDLYLPSLPAITDALGTTPTLVQLTIPLYMVSFALAHLFFGPLSDKVGRRKVILFGLLFSLLGTIPSIFVTDIRQLIAARFVQGVGLGAAVCVCRPAIRDIAHGDAFAHLSSILATCSAIFMALGPAVGGYLQQYFGWRSPFIFLSIYSIFVLILSYARIHETNKNLRKDALKPKIFFGTYLKLLTHPIFMGYSLAASVTLGGTMAYFTASPFILQKQMGLSPVIYGWTVLIVAAGMAIGGYLNQILLRHFGRHRSLVVGIYLLYIGGLSMLACALLSFANPYTFIIPMGFFAFGMSITISNATAGAFTPFADIAGFAGALFGCIFILGAAFSSSLIASFTTQTPLLVAIFLLISATTALFLQCVAFLSVDKK